MTPFLLPFQCPTCFNWVWQVIKVMTTIQKLSGNGNVTPQFTLQHHIPVWIIEKIARISRPLIQQGLLCVNAKVVEPCKGIDQSFCSTDSDTMRYDGPKNRPSVNQHSKRALYSDSKLQVVVLVRRATRLEKARPVVALVVVGGRILTCE
jgi:hypothetical protein